MSLAQTNRDRGREIPRETHGGNDTVETTPWKRHRGNDSAGIHLALVDGLKQFLGASQQR